MNRVALGTVLALGLSTSVARAQEPEPPSHIHELAFDLRADLPITLIGASAWITSEILKGYLAPASCRWCDRADDGTDTLNALDAALRGPLGSRSAQRAANMASNVTGFGLGPALAFGLDAVAVAVEHGSAEDWAVDALVIAESAMVAADLNQLVKFAVGRERPFVHVLGADDKDDTEQPSDNNLSFFSGHTTLGFSLAVSSGMVASLRGYRMAPVIWASGVSAAAITGWLRIAADKHYFTDVLTGMLVGSGIGVLVPYLHRPSAAAAEVSGVYASAARAGGTFGFKGSF
ncbi:MAG: phosphatase PAP2 family protein [Polyangiaceae bacterium]|nr:phosphatase PAP2 family protein [Polyangiaceae bacterium]